MDLVPETDEREVTAEETAMCEFRCCGKPSSNDSGGLITGGSFCRAALRPSRGVAANCTAGSGQSVFR